MEPRTMAGSLCLLPLLACAALLASTCHGAANVTLSTITLHKKFSWFTTPKIYFSCKRSNETLVMKAPVKSLDITYNMTGREEWQPVTKLDPMECQECELFESTWLGKGHLTHWNVCADNFTASNHASFIHSEPGYVELNLSCPVCAQSSFHTPVLSDEGELTIPSDVVPLFWMGIGVASLGALLIIVGSVVYIRMDEQAEDHEKQKFIEMSEDEDFAHSHGGSDDGGDCNGEEGEDTKLVVASSSSKGDEQV